MPDRETLLWIADEVIAELERHIRWSEDAMVAGLPPMDIESSRVKLAELKKRKRELIEYCKYC